MTWPVLVFDIETIPDIAGLVKLHKEYTDLQPKEVYLAWCKERQAEGKTEFLPLYLQRVLCISVVFRNLEGLHIHSFVDRDGNSEAKVIQRFFDVIEKHHPQLVSWNGTGFDLPVLHYRGLQHGITANVYWDMGQDNRDFKYNNYINRYHLRHLDLMDLLALYQPRSNAPLDALAKLCGFAGKLGIDGSQVYENYLNGKTETIREYCETDVLNTYLLYCRFQKMRYGLSETEYEQEIRFVRQNLHALPGQHWKEYLAIWKE